MQSIGQNLGLVFKKHSARSFVVFDILAKGLKA